MSSHEITALDPSLLDALEEGMLWLDGRRRIARVNSALARMAERVPARIVGQPLGSLLADPQGTPVDEPIALETARLRMPDGTLRPVALRPAPGGALLVRDRAREARLERELWRASAGAGSPGASSEAGALLEHEIRTASTVIGGYLRMLARGQAGETGAPMRELLDLALREVDRIGRLADELLDLAQGERGGELRVVRKPERLGDVIAGAVAAYAPLAQGHGVEIELDADGDPPFALDRARIEELLRNLLANATEHSPDGGRVRVVTQLVECDAGLEFHLSVFDDGPGIRPEDASRIFEPHVRLRDDGPGRGLGLALCRQVAEAHGGSIRAETSGPGGHVRVTFPLGRE
jgi:signal transduction histidine kinase